MSSEEVYEFTFEDNRKYIMFKQDFIEISPHLYSRIIKNNISNIIKVPNYIKYPDFNDFVEIYSNYISRLRKLNHEQSSTNINLIINRYNTNIVKLIQISEFFENISFSKILIKDCIFYNDKDNFKNINLNLNQNSYYNDSISFLLLSYNKLKEINLGNKPKKTSRDNNKSEEDIENVWLELFMKSLDNIGTNLNCFFNSNNTDYEHTKLWSLEKKILDEIYEIYSNKLISNNILIHKNETEMIMINNEENIIEYDILEKIVNFLMKKRDQKDIFYLLADEYLRIISEENMNELNNLPNPSFILKINTNDIDNFYEEYTLKNLFIDNFKLIIIVYYKKSEDSFNVSIKLSKNDSNSKSSFDIITFLSLSLIEEINNKQINLKSLYNNKSMIEIYKINNFKNILLSRKKNNSKDNLGMNEYFTFKLFLKPCYTYILLSNYLFYNLENLANNENISKLNKNLLSKIISKKYLNKNEELNNKNNSDYIVECLINWLNDEINVVEDISEIIKSIRWENVSLSKFFEFFIKYSSNFISNDVEYVFSKALLKIFNEFNKNINLLSQEILKAMTIASKKINYISLFCENKKNKKFNLFELISQRRYIHSELSNKDINKKYKTTNNSLINTTEKRDINSSSKNRKIPKNNTNYFKNNKIDTSIDKRELKLDKNPINSKNDKLANNKDISNISFNSNNISYNNYFSNYNNSVNINIRLHDIVKKVNKNSKNKKIKNNKMQFRKKKILSLNKNKNQKYNDKSNSKSINREKNTSYINTTNLKKKLETFHHNNNLNKTINIKNLKHLQNKIMNNRKNESRNKTNNIYINIHTETNNKSNINESSSYNNFDKNNPKKNNFKFSNKINKNETSKNKNNKNKMWEILKLVKKGKKTDEFISHLNSKNNSNYK